MTDPNYTHLALVVDRSGSMSPYVADTVGGINQLLKEQREVEGRCTVSLLVFDNELEWRRTFAPLEDVADVTPEDVAARGSTALNDAIATAIASTGKALAELDEDKRPGKVVLAIMTDGQENASTDYPRHRTDEVKAMVEHHEKTYSWLVLFLAQGLDAKSEAAAYGIAPQNAMGVARSAEGTSAAYQGTSRAVASYRGGGSGALVDSKGDPLAPPEARSAERKGTGPRRTRSRSTSSST